jgi:NAD(P)-dependent dehydrogenase (short-subunit alcohol dehydrogenase family)
MGRIVITGSADGLGLLAARQLVAEGHEVFLHARNAARGAEAVQQVPGAGGLFTADLSSPEETRRLADELNTSGPFDAIIHNAGVYQAPAQTIFAVNTLAPYLLTALVDAPGRLIYLSSGMHLQGRLKPESFTPGSASITYSDSKLHVLMLALAAARKWPHVLSNAIDPGWVPTKMGGSAAPDDLREGYETQVWLATSNDERARVSGRYFHHKQERPCNPSATDIEMQNRFLDHCAKVTGVEFPG